MDLRRRLGWRSRSGGAEAIRHEAIMADCEGLSAELHRHRVATHRIGSMALMRLLTNQTPRNNTAMARRDV